MTCKEIYWEINVAGPTEHIQLLKSPLCEFEKEPVSSPCANLINF